MKILFVITSLGIGGAERQVLNLADSLSAMGHQIQIAYLTGPARLMPKNPNIKVVPISISKSPFRFARGYLRLRRLISDFKPDVVHSHMVHGNLLARVVRLTTKIPKLVCTAHNTNEGGWPRMFAYRLTDSLADISTNVSKEAVEVFEAKGAAPPGRMLVIYNGIDTQKFSPDSAERESFRNKFAVGSDKIILAVGRLSKQKDYPNLVNAFKNISRKAENIRLWIIGDGPLRESLESLVAELGLIERVMFLGTLHDNDIPNFMRAADVFVLSSAWEGFGLVVAEAMATEKVVVATNSGGVKEVVGNCGFLVPPQDSEALAYALEKALNMTSEQAKVIGEKSRKRIVENFSLDSVVERWLEIYSASNAYLY
jgi:glycosyltransferase involved in cell wall biosynthesis